MTVINTNIASLRAQVSLNGARDAAERAMEQLSSGFRVNSAGDDAAGLAISSRMTAQIQGLKMAVKNANDGMSLADTAESAMTEVTNMLQRMRELALQSANGTYSVDDRSYLDAEVQQLKAEIDRVADVTRFNDKKLLDGADLDASSNPLHSNSFELQIGAKGDETVTITIRSLLAERLGRLSEGAAPTPADPDTTYGAVFREGTSVTAAANGDVISIDTITVETANDAQNAVLSIDKALEQLNGARADLGAMRNRLEHTVNNLTAISTNTQAARSRIMDTDYAEATSEMTKNQILNQASTAMLAQANKISQSVLSLLQ